MNTQAKALFRDMQTSYIRLLTQANEISDALDNELSQSQLADTGYAARELEKLAGQLKTRLGQLHVKAQKVLCLRWVTSTPDEANIKTEYCTAIPSVKQRVSIPSLKSDPELFRQVMVDFLGVPEMYCLDYECLRPYYPGFNDLLTDLTAEGKPLPTGIAPNRVIDDFVVSYRKRKGILSSS